MGQPMDQLGEEHIKTNSWPKALKSSALSTVTTGISRFSQTGRGRSREGEKASFQHGLVEMLRLNTMTLWEPAILPVQV